MVYQDLQGEVDRKVQWDLLECLERREVMVPQDRLERLAHQGQRDKQAVRGRKGLLGLLDNRGQQVHPESLEVVVHRDPWVLLGLREHRERLAPPARWEVPDSPEVLDQLVSKVLRAFPDQLDLAEHLEHQDYPE